MWLEQAFRQRKEVFLSSVEDPEWDGSGVKIENCAKNPAMRQQLVASGEVLRKPSAEINNSSLWDDKTKFLMKSKK